MPPSTKEARLRQRANRRERDIGKHCGAISGKGRNYRKHNFPNFLVALQVCKRLSAVGCRHGEPHPNPLYVYHCECCGGIHVGHLAAGESVLMYGPESVNIREAQNIHA